MAAPLAVGNVLRVVFTTQLGSQAGLNIRYYQVTATGGLSLSVNAAAGVLDGIAGPLYAPLLTNTARYRGLSMQRVVPVLGEIPVVSTIAAANGTAGTAPLPGNVAGIFTVLTGFTGRANRGRTYAPFPDAADLTTATGDPVPTAGYMTRLGAMSTIHWGATSLVVGADSATVQAVLFRPSTLVTKDLTSATARVKWGSIHRRGSYGRQNP